MAGRDVRLARVHGADGRNEFLGGHALEQIGARARLQRTIDVLVAVVGGQHNEAGLRIFHANALNHFNTAQAGQAQIDEGDVGLVLANLRNRLHSVGGFTHDFNAFHHVKQRHQTLAHHVMIFDDQDANRFLCHSDSFMAFESDVRSRTVVPEPGALVTSRVPPMVAARSRIPVRP